LMQIVRDFCEHANAICADCRFPELVAGFKLQAAGSENRQHSTSNLQPI